MFVLVLGGASTSSAAGADGLERVVQKMVAPPFLPEHSQVAVGGPKVIQVRLVVDQKEMQIAPDVWIQAMTFNGSIPGPIIVVHQGDYIELTLVNPSKNTFLHNIDFHASSGAMGASELTKVSPGHQVVLRFKATKSGVFVYHCASGEVMIPYHVASGMNGAIMVLPRSGLRDNNGNLVKYDRAYYIGEQDFYVPMTQGGKYKRFQSTAEAMGEIVETMRNLTPSHVVFNGAVGALKGDNALTAKVGERVLFIHSQANRDSRPHLIGGHGDMVWKGGSFSDPPATNYESWFVAGGSAVAAMHRFVQPGVYAYVNHNLIEDNLMGASAHVVVDGKWNNDLMEQVAESQIIK